MRSRARPWLLALLPLGAALLLLWWLRAAAPEPAPELERAAPAEPPTSRHATRGTAAGPAGHPPGLHRWSDAGLDAARPDGGAEGDAGEEHTDLIAARSWLTRNAQLAERNVELFCEESRKLAAAGLADAPGSSRDAWAYMSVRVDWEDDVRSKGLLHLPEPLRQRLREYGAQWPARISEGDAASLDFTWLGELKQFDHWSVLRDLPLRHARESNFYDAPIPNFIELQSWVKLRLARALGTGELAQASSEVRHLAKLLRSTGLVIGDMVAYRLLALEREAWEAARAQGREVGGWQPYAAEDLERYRRLARSSPNFVFPGVSEEVMRKALACNVISRCSAIYEAVGTHAVMGHLAATDTSAAVREISDGSGCDPELLAWLRKNKASTPEQVLRTFPTGDGMAWLTPDAGR